MASGLQFSIRAVIVATTLIGVAATACAAEPSWKSLIALESLAVFFAVASIIAARLTTDETKSFWTGAAVTLSLSLYQAATVLTWFVPYYRNGNVDRMLDVAQSAANSLRILLPAVWCAAFVIGMLAAFFHVLFFSNR